MQIGFEIERADGFALEVDSIRENEVILFEADAIPFRPGREEFGVSAARILGEEPAILIKGGGGDLAFAA